MMNFFKKLFGKKGASVDMAGQPVHVNLPPADSRAIARHLARIYTCRHVLANERRSDSQHFRDEIIHRTKALALANIEVPSSDEQLMTMIKHYGG